MNTKIQILVCCHKKDFFEDKSPYLPIHVGKNLNPNLDLGIQCDNVGENISEKNGSYCELTGLYWAWKNLKGIDVIGLCHYRRYFDFHKQVSSQFACVPTDSKSLDNIDLSIPEDIIQKVSKGAIVLSKPLVFPHSLQLDYCSNHLSTDFMVLQEHFNTMESKEMKEAFYEVMYRQNKLSPFNMFLMSWSDFDNYCSWLFPLLADVESKIDISHYSTMQKRVFGFMAERLLCVYVYAMRKKIIYKPVLWCSSNQLKMNSLVRFFINFIYNITFKIIRKPLSYYLKK